jgi:hypothetical protein
MTPPAVDPINHGVVATIDTNAAAGVAQGDVGQSYLGACIPHGAGMGGIGVGRATA